jgi:hypothetical protein
MATTKLLPIVLPRTKKQTSKPATTNNKNRAIMKKATTTTTPTTTANSNTSHAAERSVAYKLHIRAEDARVLLVDAQSRVGPLNWSRLSCPKQVAAAEKVWNDLPLKDQHEIRNRMDLSRQKGQPMTTAAASSVSASSTMHQSSGNSNKYQNQEQQRRITATAAVAAAAIAATATASATTTTATTTENGGVAAATDVGLELIPCLLECLFMPFSQG